jgi:hypothetical protein
MVNPLAALAEEDVAESVLQQQETGDSVQRKNVIFITWDGVRPQEFAGLRDPKLSLPSDEPLLPYFHEYLAPRGSVYGIAGHPRAVSINPSLISLPAYQTIMAGAPVSCVSNKCKSIKSETFPERLVREAQLPYAKVAMIGSWENLRYAAAREGEPFFVNTGMSPVPPVFEDEVTREIQALSEADRPSWPSARYDKYTQQLALHYLKRYQPNFLMIGFNDSDEYGHKGDYESHTRTLNQYDKWLQELMETLAAMDSYGPNTCLFITTDHGRGEGKNWRNHSSVVPAAARIWLYGSCNLFGETADQPMKQAKRATNLAIRPTIESLMGLAPHRCVLCDKPLPEFKGVAANSLSFEPNYKEE